MFRVGQYVCLGDKTSAGRIDTGVGVVIDIEIGLRGDQRVLVYWEDIGLDPTPWRAGWLTLV